MFWIVDSIIKSKNTKKRESPPRRKYRHKQRVYLPLADLERSVEDIEPVAAEDNVFPNSDNELLTDSYSTSVNKRTTV